MNDHENMNAADAATVPPHSDEAEQSVLGGLLLDNAAHVRIGGVIAPSHFYHPQHAAIMTTIMELIEADQPADVITVHQRGGHAMLYLNSLAQSTPSAANIRRYSEIVRDRWKDRETIKAAVAMIAAARDAKTPMAEKMLAAQESLATIAADSATSEPVHVDETTVAWLEHQELRGEGKDEVLKTKLIDLDNLLNGGMRDGQLIVIAARPSMGKTTLGMTIARNVAGDEGVLVLTMEMSTQQLNDASVSALGNVPLDKVLQPTDDGDTWSRITEGVERLQRLHMYVDDQPALRLTDVRAKLLTANRKHMRKTGKKIKLIVVDYIQLMLGDGENRAVQIALIANGLKAIAKKNGCAVLALAQCNREADKKPDGADAMSDINESGGIEAAADMVCLIHREYVRTNDPKLENYGSLRVPKNRIGKTGRVHLWFQGDKQFFGSYSGPAPIPTQGIVRATHSAKGMRNE